MSEERIEIPLTEKGMLCYMRLADIVRKRLHRARDAAIEYAALKIPEAEFIDEDPMRDYKYLGIFILPNGKKCGVSYDYISHSIVEVVDVDDDC